MDSMQAAKLLNRLIELVCVQEGRYLKQHQAIHEISFLHSLVLQELRGLLLSM